MIDSTILIDYFRKTDKQNSRLLSHIYANSNIFISTVTEFEIITGASELHTLFWNEMMARFTILNFDSAVAREAALIVQRLKKKRKTIDKPDLFIAATAIVHGLPLDTANKKHFMHIDGLVLVA